MKGDQGVTEIVGVVLLIGIIVAAFGIFAAFYIPSLIPTPIPQVRLSMACNDTHSIDSSIEYPCNRGSFGCHPFNKKTCEDNCEWKDYSENTQISSDQKQLEVLRCKEDCMGPICSDLAKCEDLYICHLGGDTLKVSDMGVLINGNLIAKKNNWMIKKQTGNMVFTSLDDSDSTLFCNGDSLRIRNIYTPVDSVMIRYTLSSGGTIALAHNQFGTDVS